MARVSRAGNQTICHAGIGLWFLWSSLAFLEALKLGVIRGRQVSTRFEVNQAGIFFVMTQGRGDSALNWFDAFRG
jgi:hypothetical protein